MKKFVTVAVFVILCCYVLPIVHADETDFIEIYSLEDLKTIANDPYGNYILTADIDMYGVEWTPVAFCGEFDGGGHTIYNLTVNELGKDQAVTLDGNHKEYDTYFAGLFSVVKDAVIKDVNLLNIDISVSTQENCFAAGLAGFAEDTAISGCSVTGRVYLNQTNRMSGVAGIVGFGHGTISDCTVDVELVFVDDNTSINCEQFLGGVLACGYTDVENCTVTLKGYASVHGYVHNGGLEGMYYVYNRAEKTREGYVRGCTVDATISFFEDNRDRRAYCKAYVGEKLNRYVTISKNTTVYFENDEIFDYDTVLLPELCSQPEYTAVITAPTCTEFGYTTYTCTDCDYAYTDDYIHPKHTPGEWVTTLEPTYTQTGTQQLNCAVCGELLDERVLPVHVAGNWEVTKESTYEESGLRQLHCSVCSDVLEEEEIAQLVYISSCKLDKTELELDYRSSAELSADLLPVDASNTDLTWNSSDLSVATVDGQGNVYATGRGNAIITCTSTDGNASSNCAVTVTYTPLQWIIVTILFGWIWY